MDTPTVLLLKGKTPHHHTNEATFRSSEETRYVLEKDPGGWAIPDTAKEGVRWLATIPNCARLAVGEARSNQSAVDVKP